MKFEYSVVFENSYDKFDIGSCMVKVAVEIVLHLAQYKLSDPKTLVEARKHVKDDRWSFFKVNRFFSVVGLIFRKVHKKHK